MSQVITTALKEMKARQNELQPLAAEFKQVEAAIQALEGAAGASMLSREHSKATTSGRRRGRPRKGERTRAEQFFALVKEHPGVTISEAAKRLDTQPTSLYRVVSKLEVEGSVERRERAIYPTEAAAT
jgi:transposase